MVTRTTCVHFTIGTYSDFVDCDVVPMQACYLLLGRHGNLIENLYIMVKLINILLYMMETKLDLNPLLRNKF
jgi:hypothetical protein